MGLVSSIKKKASSAKKKVVKTVKKTVKKVSNAVKDAVDGASETRKKEPSKKGTAPARDAAGGAENIGNRPAQRRDGAASGGGANGGGNPGAGANSGSSAAADGPQFELKHGTNTTAPSTPLTQQQRRERDKALKSGLATALAATGPAGAVAALGLTAPPKKAIPTKPVTPLQKFEAQQALTMVAAAMGSPAGLVSAMAKQDKKAILTQAQAQGLLPDDATLDGDGNVVLTAKKGDNYWNIAARMNGGTVDPAAWQRLVEENATSRGQDPNLLQVGEKVILTGRDIASLAAQVKPPQTPTPPSTQSQSHGLLGGLSNALTATINKALTGQTKTLDQMTPAEREQTLKDQVAQQRREDEIRARLTGTAETEALIKSRKQYLKGNSSWVQDGKVYDLTQNDKGYFVLTRTEPTQAPNGAGDAVLTREVVLGLRGYTKFNLSTAYVGQNDENQSVEYQQIQRAQLNADGRLLNTTEGEKQRIDLGKQGFATNSDLTTFHLDEHGMPTWSLRNVRSDTPADVKGIEDARTKLFANIRTRYDAQGNPIHDTTNIRNTTFGTISKSEDVPFVTRWSQTDTSSATRDNQGRPLFDSQGALSSTATGTGRIIREVQNHLIGAGQDDGTDLIMRTTQSGTFNPLAANSEPTWKPASQAAPVQTTPAPEKDKSSPWWSYGLKVANKANPITQVWDGVTAIRDLATGKKGASVWDIPQLGQAKGAGTAVIDLATGVWELGKMAVRSGDWYQVVDKKAYDEQWATNKQIVDRIKEDPMSLVDAIVKPYKEAIDSGHEYEALGRGGVDLLSLFVGPKGIDKAIKATKAGTSSAANALKAGTGSRVVGGGRFSHDVVVGGLGPGGATALNTAHDMGLRTLGIEMRNATGTRSNVVVVDSETMRILDEFKPQNGGPELPPGEYAHSISSIENQLRARAAEVGIPMHFNTAITGVQQLWLGGVKVKFTLPDGTTQTVLARKYIDATGGRTLQPTGTSTAAINAPKLTLKQLDPDAVPQEFVMGHWPSLTNFKKSVTVDGKRIDFLVFANRRDGMSVFANMSSDNPLFAGLTQAQRRDLFDRATKEAGLDPATRKAAAEFSSVDRGVQQARQRDILLVGDSVAWKSPYTQKGLNQAIMDGRNVSQAIHEYLNGNKNALRDYANETLVDHYMYMYRPPPA